MVRRFAKVSEEEIEEAYFIPSDLVNTKTTIPLRVGEEQWIYTSTLRVSVYIHHYSPPLRGIVVYYYPYFPLYALVADISTSLCPLWGHFELRENLLENICSSKQGWFLLWGTCGFNGNSLVLVVQVFWDGAWGMTGNSVTNSLTSFLRSFLSNKDIWQKSWFGVVRKCSTDWT